MDVDAKVANHCWATEGLWGDASCAELKKVLHCRNCVVYECAAEKAIESFQKNKPLAAEPPAPAKTAAECVPMFVFSRSGTHFAVVPEFVGEITRAETVHRIPHRTGGAVEGISNIDGDLVLVVEICRACGLDCAGAGESKLSVLCKIDGEKFAFKADAVAGIVRVEKPKITEGAGAPFVGGTFVWGGAEVKILDVGLLSSAVIRRMV